MRLIEKNLKQVQHFRDEQRESGYVGTETVPVLTGMFNANVQPAENKLSIEMYGNKVSEMLALFIPLQQDVGIKNGDSVALNGNTPTHKTVSVKQYTTHTVALVERIATNGN